MHVVVFTRSTPDTAAKVEVGASGAVTWGDEEPIVNPWDEYALEEAITLAKNAGGTSTVIAVGPQMHEQALKQSLAMGMESAMRVWQEGMSETDSLTFATAAAAAVRHLGDVSLVIFGRESIDTNTDQHVYQTARKLGWPVLSFVSKIAAVDFDAGAITVERLVEQGRQVVASRLPAVISVVKDINEPRYPTLIGIRKAAKAQIPVLSLADVGATPPAARTRVTAYRNLPARDAQVEMMSGTPEEQARALADRLHEEGLL